MLDRLLEQRDPFTQSRALVQFAEMKRVATILLFLFLLLCSEVAAGAEEKRAWIVDPGECTLPERAPMVVVKPPVGIRFIDAVVTSKTDRVIVSRIVRVVRLWPALAQYWWQVAGGIALVLALILLVRLWHRRGLRRALAYAVLVAAIPVAVLLLGGFMPRRTWLSDIAEWPSVGAYAWAREHGQEWLLREVSEWGDVVELDPRTGEVLATLLRRPLSQFPPPPACDPSPAPLLDDALSSKRRPPPARARLFCGTGWEGVYVVWVNPRGWTEGSMERLSLDSNEVRRHTLWPRSGLRSEWLVSDIAVSRDGNSLCAALISPTRREAITDPIIDEVLAWHVDLGWRRFTSVELLSLTYLGYLHSLQGRPFATAVTDSRIAEEAHKPCLVPCSAPGQFLILHGDARTESGPALIAGMLIDADKARQKVEFRKEASSGLRDAVGIRLADGGGGLLIRDLDGNGQWDVRSVEGELRGMVRLPPEEYDYAAMTTSPDGRYVFLEKWEIVGPPVPVDVLDLQEGRWAMRLGRPPRRLSMFGRLVASSRLAVSLETESDGGPLLPGEVWDRLVIWSYGPSAP